MDFWQNIYTNFDVVAFEIFGLKVHWYGIMYVLALLVALMVAKYYAIKDNMGISKAMLDSYFIWVEIGVILGARLGYILIYDANTLWYITHPWQIFNPFYNGEFIGIRGMSYHGAVFGFLIASYLFCKKHKQNLWKYLDLVAISVPCGYIFGRIGNFLNQELFGRITDVPWGIYIDGVLRHPSQLYEAFLEGLVVFIILLFIKKYKKYNGELIAYYTILYALARFVCEFYREPDFGIGFIAFGMSMGQILSLLMLILGVFLSFYLRNIKKNL